jgi:cell division protein FtsL
LEAQQALAPLWRILFITGIVMVLAIGVVWVARVNLTDATMKLTAASEQLARETEDARAQGAHLEVQYALATSPTTIQEAAATSLGMSPDPQVDYLRIAAGD